mmetsp:Transcript_97325/g.275755  ORF Transcript_97325/g.275755 Transcript_97325/m.275755 type:complete len:578 (-) Transcript_97325:88-1821(-)
MISRVATRACSYRPLRVHHHRGELLLHRSQSLLQAFELVPEVCTFVPQLVHLPRPELLGVRLHFLCHSGVRQAAVRRIRQLARAVGVAEAHFERAWTRTRAAAGIARDQVQPHVTGDARAGEVLHALVRPAEGDQEGVGPPHDSPRPQHAEAGERIPAAADGQVQGLVREGLVPAHGPPRSRYRPGGPLRVELVHGLAQPLPVPGRDGQDQLDFDLVLGPARRSGVVAQEVLHRDVQPGSLHDLVALALDPLHLVAHAEAAVRTPEGFINLLRRALPHGDHVDRVLHHRLEVDLVVARPVFALVHPVELHVAVHAEPQHGALVHQHDQHERRAAAERHDEGAATQLVCQKLPGPPLVLRRGVEDTSRDREAGFVVARPVAGEEGHADGAHEAAPPVDRDGGDDVVDQRRLQRQLREGGHRGAQEPEDEGVAAVEPRTPCGDGDQAGQDADRQTLRGEPPPVHRHGLAALEEGAPQRAQRRVERHLAGHVGLGPFGAERGAGVEAVPAHPEEEDAEDQRHRVCNRYQLGGPDREHVVFGVLRSPHERRRELAPGRHVVREAANARTQHAAAHDGRGRA